MFFVIIILVICLLVINYYKFEYPHTHFLNELEIYNFILADNDDYLKIYQMRIYVPDRVKQ